MCSRENEDRELWRSEMNCLSAVRLQRSLKGTDGNIRNLPLGPLDPSTNEAKTAPSEMFYAGSSTAQEHTRRPRKYHKATAMAGTWLDIFPAASRRELSETELGYETLSSARRAGPAHVAIDAAPVVVAERAPVQL